MTSSAPNAVVQALPSRLARLPFYYGWVMVLMAAWAMTATLPGRTHGLGLITQPLVEDPTLGINNDRFSQLNFWAVPLGSALCIPAGRLIDRMGVRVATVVVAVALGLSVLWMSRVTTVLALFLSLTLIRGFGQGALSVVSMAMIGKWFTRRLGPAMGVYCVLLGIGFIAATIGVGLAVANLGWRTVWAGVGVALIVGLAVPGWLLVRRSPESLGLSVEGDKSDESLHSAGDLTARAALHTPTFWTVTLACSFFNLTWSAITLFNESVLAERGFDHDTFILVMAVLVAVGIPANLISGWLATRWRMGRLLAIGMLMLAGSLAAFPWLTSTGQVVAYAAMLGIAGGIITVVFFSVYGKAFGRSHLGTIQAVVQTITVFASAAGPLVLTRCHVASGSYAMFFHIAAPIAALLGLATWSARLPGEAASPA